MPKKHHSKLIPCPSTASYQRGCRCEGCKDAKRKYYGQKPKPNGTICGSQGKYKRGCRCNLCVEVIATRNAAQRYGITKEHVIALRSIETCPLCLIEINTNESSRGHIDHCHTTGKVRGMLCQDCNQGLGHFRDNPDALRRAAQYLDRYADES